jgi:hypothetical protein
MALINDPVSAVANAVQSIVERVIPDPAAQIAAKEALAQLYMQGDIARMTAQAGVISAEAASTNKLTSSWRPMLMYVFMIIIFNNYFLAPYMQAMFHFGLQLSVPPDMWDLLKICVGGYVVGRSAEKAGPAMVAAFKGGNINGGN